MITENELAAALTLADLTDISYGPHAMQLLMRDIITALDLPTYTYRGSRIVSVRDNYEALQYPKDAAARDVKYTRYISDETILRTQTSALIPGALKHLQVQNEILVACPGIVYRRDVIDRMHTGEPHQLDLWHVSYNKLTDDDLLGMIAQVCEAILPGCVYRVNDVTHPYTLNGKEIEIQVGDMWVEIGECGLAHPDVLCNPRWSGLAMGIGLDRALMLRKQMHDIRLLRSDDPRVKIQMLDLLPYREVSSMPPVLRDLSLAVSIHHDDQTLGDILRVALGKRAEMIESMEILSETAYVDLPPQAHNRMGMSPHHKNILLRVCIRHTTRTLTAEEGNSLRDDMYRVLHEGTRGEYTKA